MCVLTEMQTLTSGAIQNGVPTDVFLRNRALVNCAETPTKKTHEKCNLLIIKRSIYSYVCLSEFSADKNTIYDGE